MPAIQEKSPIEPLGEKEAWYPQWNCATDAFVELCFFGTLQTARGGTDSIPVG